MADGTDPSVTVVLASASPRRRDLLRRLGIEPDVRPVDVDETPRPDERGAVLAVRLAEAKCRAATATDDELVVAADTVVVVGGRPLGKPADPDEARAMLGELSGRAHEVVTGVAVRHRGRCRVTAVTTIVEVRVLADAEVRAYVATGEPMDKAGAYAIQGLGGAFVTAIAGSDSNVVGLPLAHTVQLARSVGVDLLAGASRPLGRSTHSLRRTPSDPSRHVASPSRLRPTLAEIFRLAIVVAFMAGAYALGDNVARAMDRADDVEGVRLFASIGGALVGYLVGGVGGRFALRSVDQASTRIESIDAPVLIAGSIGATLAGVLGIVLSLPVMVLPGKAVTVPIALAAILVLVYAGGHIGVTRGGDLSKFVGVRGRVQVNTPSRGASARIVDTSALIDGRIVDIARCGFLTGTLVVPQFVLDEVQGLADTEDIRRRSLGRRGLDTLRTLQDDGIVPVEVTLDDPRDVATVDGKLAALCRSRGASLVTTDANLASVAEVGGVRVLNVHALAEAVRPPATPGDRFTVRIVKLGTEEGQGVGYLDDGTMVVVERAAPQIGAEVDVDVTSVMTSRRGRMLFATIADHDRTGG